jgi:hypothetical protein
LDETEYSRIENNTIAVLPVVTAVTGMTVARDVMRDPGAR